MKFVHTYGPGLHSGDMNPDVDDPRWQRRQVDDFVEFAVLAEELGFDGITVTEHHAPLMTCPSPHLTLYAAGGRRPVPATDGEFQTAGGTGKPNRPAIAVSGTPEQVAGALQQVIDETGARRVLVETFSRAEARLFAREVIPALKERNATAA